MGVHFSVYLYFCRCLWFVWAANCNVILQIAAWIASCLHCKLKWISFKLPPPCRQQGVVGCNWVNPSRVILHDCWPCKDFQPPRSSKNKKEGSTIFIFKCPSLSTLPLSLAAKFRIETRCSRKNVDVYHNYCLCWPIFVQFSSQAQYFFVAKLSKHFAFFVRYSLTTWLFVYMNYYTHNAQILDFLMPILYMFNLIDMNFLCFSMQYNLGG